MEVQENFKNSWFYVFDVKPKIVSQKTGSFVFSTDSYVPFSITALECKRKGNEKKYYWRLKHLRALRLKALSW